MISGSPTRTKRMNSAIPTSKESGLTTSFLSTDKDSKTNLIPMVNSKIQSSQPTHLPSTGKDKSHTTVDKSILTKITKINMVLFGKDQPKFQDMLTHLFGEVKVSL